MSPVHLLFVSFKRPWRLRRWSSGWDLALPCGGCGFSPFWGARILQVWQQENQNIKQKLYCNKFNKDFRSGQHLFKSLKRKKTFIMMQMIELNCPAILKKFILLKCSWCCTTKWLGYACTFSLFRALSHYGLSQASDSGSLTDSRTSLFFLPPFSMFLSNFCFLLCFRLLASCPACLMATVSSDPILPLQILEYYLNLEFLIFAMYVSWKIKLSDYQLKGNSFF